MPARNPDLHGYAPDKCAVALLLIDVINDMEFEDGRQMLAGALPMARNLARLKQRAHEADIPVVYVNDNFGRWQSSFEKLVQHCLGDVFGKPLAELLRPDPDDYFVLKPKHSGFFETPLDVLLRYLGAESVIITGITADICVLFTANDAYMRDYRLFVPSDCVAARTPAEKEHALEVIAKILKADIRPSTELNLDQLKTPASP